MVILVLIYDLFTQKKCLNFSNFVSKLQKFVEFIEINQILELIKKGYFCTLWR
jgi:hypothetical protein